MGFWIQNGIIAISVVYLITFLVLSFFDNYLSYSKRIRKIMIVFFVFSLSAIAFCLEPMENDLSRHFEYLERIKYSGKSLTEFLLNSQEGGSQYNGLITFNLFRYIFVRLFNNKHFFPAITVAVDYSIFAYILIDYNKHKVNKGMLHIINFTMCFAFMPYLYAYSGIRNALAASVMALAVYQYLYKQGSILRFIFFSMTAFTIHPIAIMVVPFVIITKLKWGWKGILGVLLFIIAVKNLANFFLNLGIDFLRRLARYYFYYTSDNQYRSAEYFLNFDILIIMIIIISYLCIRKNALKKMTSQKYSLIYFTAFYSMAIMTFLGNYDMILRPAYFLGAFSPVVSTIFIERELWDKNLLWLRKLFLSVCILYGMYVTVRYMKFLFIWSYNFK